MNNLLQLVRCFILSSILLPILALSGASASESLFYSSQITMPAGERVSIPLRSEVLSQLQANSNNLEFATSSGQLQVVYEAVIPKAGYTTAFTHVQAASPGTHHLSLGGHTLQVNVLPERDGPLDRLRSPRIYSPVMDAVVWGDFSVGVEILADQLSEEELQDGLRLRLFDGQELKPTGSTPPEKGPGRILRFDVPGTSIAPGAITLTPVLSRGDDQLIGNPLKLTLIEAPTDRMIAGECESIPDIEREFRNRKPGQKLRITDDPTASGGKFVNNGSPRPAWILPVEADVEGSYQLMMRVKGDLGLNSYPTVGLFQNDANRPLSSCRVVDTEWHRLPIGTPMYLTNGLSHITVLFENDFNIKKRGNRNLYLDRFEIARIGQSPADETPGGMMGMAPVMDAGMAGGGDLRVFIDQPPAGRRVAGAVVLRVEAMWDSIKHPVAPELVLLLNGKPILSEFGPRSYFRIPRAHFVEGRNELQCVAYGPDGGVAYSQMLTLEAGPHDEAEMERTRLRFSVFDPRWDSSVRERIEEKDRKNRKEKAVFARNGSESLSLPDPLTGTYRLLLRAYGQPFEGPPEFSVYMITADGTNLLKRQALTGSIKEYMIAPGITFEEGPKQLKVSFENDLYTESVGDRNAFLESVILFPVANPKDVRPPVVSVRYPQSNHVVSNADVVVVESDDDRTVKWIELIVDGQRSGIRHKPIDGLGYVVLPLSARSLTPGKHVFTIQAADGYDNRTTTEERVFTVVEDPHKAPGTYAKAVHALNRLALGPEPEELAAILIHGVEAWLTARLSPEAHHDFMNLDQARARFAVMGAVGQTTPRSFQHLLKSENPVLARLQIWIENHFSTWLKKTRGSSKWDDHTLLSQFSTSNFSDLLFASATSPAMLLYLDQQRSFAGKMNENYAREIMELHCLGVDNAYKQKDVTELARIFTGWSAVNESDVMGDDQREHFSFRYDPDLNDHKAKEYLGLPFPEVPAPQRFAEVKRAIEMLATHPETAQFISTKFCKHYLSGPVSEPLSQEFARRFLESGGDLRQLLTELVRSNEFWDAAGQPRLSTPIEYGLKLERLAGRIDVYGLGNFLSSAGMQLYDRDTPDGYPDEGEAYADSNGFMQRMRYAEKRSAAIRNTSPYPAAAPAKDEAFTVWTQNLVDALSISINGSLLTPSSNTALMEMASEPPKNLDQFRQEIITLICQLPESQLR